MFNVYSSIVNSVVLQILRLSGREQLNKHNARLSNTSSLFTIAYLIQEKLSMYTVTALHWCTRAHAGRELGREKLSRQFTAVRVEHWPKQNKPALKLKQLPTNIGRQQSSRSANSADGACAHPTTSTVACAPYRLLQTVNFADNYTFI